MFLGAAFVEAIYHEDQSTNLHIDQSEKLLQLRICGLRMFLCGIYLLSYLERRIA